MKTLQDTALELGLLPQDEAVAKVNAVIDAKVERGGTAFIKRGDLVRVLGITPAAASALLRQAYKGGLGERRGQWWGRVASPLYVAGVIRAILEKDSIAHRIFPSSPIHDAIGKACGVPLELMNGPCIVPAPDDEYLQASPPTIDLNINIPKEASDD